MTPSIRTCGPLVLALSIFTMGCENASDASRTSNLMISGAHPVDGNATLTGIGVVQRNASTLTNVVTLHQTVGGVQHAVLVEYAISTDEIVSVSHDWDIGF